MALTIKSNKPTVWLLVKVPRITDVGSGADKTEKELRESIRDNHFGGEHAAVRRLTADEIGALAVARVHRCAAPQVPELESLETGEGDAR